MTSRFRLVTYRHPVPISPNTIILVTISSILYRHLILDDGIGLLWSSGVVVDANNTDPVPDDGTRSWMLLRVLDIIKGTQYH